MDGIARDKKWRMTESRFHWISVFDVNRRINRNSLCYSIGWLQVRARSRRGRCVQYRLGLGRMSSPQAGLHFERFVPVPVHNSRDLLQCFIMQETMQSTSTRVR